jgi:acyl-CoA thioesterase FadM
MQFPVRLPRHAFSPRNAARAGDLWRAFQEVATEASAAVGWPPARYRECKVGFIVREMTAVHYRETPHGEPITATTWVRDFRRGLLTTREIRLVGADGPLADASQEWVHVRANMDTPGEPPLKPARAGADILSAFLPEDREPSPQMPGFEAMPGREHRMSFGCWQVWMDPLGHANHPMYVDWCDEALSRAMAGVGLDPIALRPVAERVRWRTGVVAGEEVVVTTRRAGRTATGDVAFEHEITRGDGTVAATAVTIRGLAGGTADALATALG